MSLTDRLRRLEARTSSGNGTGDARARLLAKLDALAERRRAAGIPDRTCTPGELDAIIVAMKARAREAGSW